MSLTPLIQRIKFMNLKRTVHVINMDRHSLEYIAASLETIGFSDIIKYHVETTSGDYLERILNGLAYGDLAIFQDCLVHNHAQLESHGCTLIATFSNPEEYHRNLHPKFDPDPDAGRVIPENVGKLFIDYDSVVAWMDDGNTDALRQMIAELDNRSGELAETE